MRAAQRIWWTWLILCLGAIQSLFPLPACRSDAAQAGETASAKRTALAEVELRDPSDATQVYQGLSYVWLGRYELELHVQGPSLAQTALEFSTGAKDDQRGFTILQILGSQTSVIKQVTYGGYDGFRDSAVPLPPTADQECVLRVQSAGPRPAFFHSVRLVQSGEQAATDSAAFRLSVKLVSIPAAEPVNGGLAAAYPEMQKLWDVNVLPSLEECEEGTEEWAFRRAAQHGRLSNEMFFRAKKYMQGWLAQADPETGLIPRNLTASRDVWNPEDAAADNYPFLVLTAFLTERSLFEGRMREMLETERRLTSRQAGVPDAWSFAKKGFVRPQVQLPALIFGGSEYVKDGLLPLSEFLGPSPWLDRLIEIQDGIWSLAPIETEWGKIPSDNIEVNGEQLQALSRLFWLTGNRKYLEWAERLGDYYLLGPHHPTRDFTSLRLRDHGCEIISGLCELYLTVHFAEPSKAALYRPAIHSMCDRVLEVGRDERGMLYNVINPQTGSHDPKICDTWGYNYNGIYTVYLVDKRPEYRQAVQFVLGQLLEKVSDYHWGSADEYADSIESAITLYNREAIPSAVTWIDRMIPRMWRPQRPDGIIEGWHGDGNVTRTGLMYAFWKTQGLRVEPWREDVCLGAILHEGQLFVSVTASQPWQGRLVFDRPRHRVFFHLPLDYPRINQFPEWFTVGENESLQIVNRTQGRTTQVLGEEAWRGVPLQLADPREIRLLVTKSSATSATR